MDILEALSKLFRDDEKKLGKDPAKELIRLKRNDMEPATARELDSSMSSNPILRELSPERRQYVEASGLGRDVRGYNAPAETIMWSSDPGSEFGAGGADKNTRDQLAMEVIRAMNDVSEAPIYERVTSGDQPTVSFIDRLASPESQVDTAAHEMVHDYLTTSDLGKGLSRRENEALVRLFDAKYASPETKSRSIQYMGEMKLSDDERNKVMDIFTALEQLLSKQNGNN